MLKVFAGSLIILSIASLAIGAELYIPRQVDGKIVTHQPDLSPNPKPEPLRTMVSQKNILGLQRAQPYGLPVSKFGYPLIAGVQDIDTINVLVLKVEFEPEDPDDPTTTGNGTFDLRTQAEFIADEGHDFDPAPHNSVYFNAHMEALRRYWYFVSDHQLRMTWDIYPESENAAYRLPHPMAYYGSDVPPDSLVDQLLLFMRDAITMVDTTTPEINFADYQSIIIFHAGSDQQNNFAFIDDTPNDFWTGFIWTQDSIAVDNDSYHVTEAIIMPETASQDNRITVLNGVMAHEFGHQLGLVDLYNTANFLTQVGNFSLMDNNCANIALELDSLGNFTMGALPCYPDAWSRAYLGFSGVTEVTSGDDLPVRAAEQTYFNNEIIKVPISNMEYYLVENRQTETDFEYTHYDPSVTIPYAIIADSATGVILGPGWGYYNNNQLVKVASGEYDRLLPGDGILIWHVDEVVAYLDYLGGGLDNFIMNSLQWDYHRRFVSLVEADGIIDFGGNYYTGYGSPGDYFYDFHNTAFTPSTNPDTRSNLGADTHISIDDIKSPWSSLAPDNPERRYYHYSDTLMYCDVATDWFQEGFPTMGFPDIGNGGGLLAMDIDGDGANELLTARNRFILAVESDGSPVMDTSAGVIIPNFDRDTLFYYIPLFAELNDYVMGNLVGGDFDGDGQLEVACFDINDSLYIFEGADTNPRDSLADLLTSTSLPRVHAGARPVVSDIDGDGRDEIIVGLAPSGLIIQLDYSDSSTLDMINIANIPGIPVQIAIAPENIFIVYDNNEGAGPSLYVGSITNGEISEVADVRLPDGWFQGFACGDINRDDVNDAVLTKGDYLCIYDGETQELTSINIQAPGALSLGDIDADGYPDIVLTAGESMLKAYAFNHRGILMDNFPVEISTKDPTYTGREPILTDLDGDQKPDILISLPDGALNWNTIVYVMDEDSLYVPRDTTFYLPTGGLTCINSNGDRLPGFPLSTSTAITVEPVISDLDGDGDIEIAAIDSAGFISAWDTGAIIRSIDAPWITQGGGIGRNGYLSPAFNKEIIVAQEFLPEGSVYNYPNPAANSTAFRYYVDRPAEINVKIFDMSGELVDELTGSTLGEVDDEINWNCSEFASGVYFARFEADAGDINKNVMIKVALIK